MKTQDVIGFRIPLGGKTELEQTIAEINALIEAELNKLMPILGEKTTAIVAMELDIDPARLKLARSNTTPESTRRGTAPSARPVMRRG